MGILGVVGCVPRALQKQALDFLAKKATAVMTNVPGPEQPLYMAGAQVRRMMFWVPQSGNIGIGVSILSYAGGVQFGLITDKRLCDEPQRIIDRFEPEFEKLVLTLCMLPWQGAVDADDAESWLFPSVDGAKARAAQGPDAAEGGVSRHDVAAGRCRRDAAQHRRRLPKRRRRARRAEPAARPAGLRRRKSAFAAARGAGPRCRRKRLFRARCLPAVLRCDRSPCVTDDGVELDRTVFYPLGGGQAGDSGWLVTADGTRLRVTDTRKSKRGRHSR